MSAGLDGIAVPVIEDCIIRPLFHSHFCVAQTAHQIYLKLKGGSIFLPRNNFDIFCMTVSSGLHCDYKLLPETPKEDLYHVGVSIPVPRGSLSNSHASHVPHFPPSAAFTWFPDVLLPPAAICKAASRVQLSHCCQDNANTATSYPSTPKHHLQPQQHLSTFSPPATRLN